MTGSGEPRGPNAPPAAGPPPAAVADDAARALRTDAIRYSLRRYWVDTFMIAAVSRLPAGARVLDVGGHKTVKRGVFDLNRCAVEPVYLNISDDKGADIVADAAAIPVPDGSYDAVVCCEVLEHVPDPLAVLRECVRVLRPGGTLLATVPFLFPVHGDPGDYGRYTEFFWREALEGQPLEGVEVTRHGGYWCTITDMLRALAADRCAGRPGPLGVRRRGWAALLRAARPRALAMDARGEARGDAFTTRFPTGYGITATRR